jgi:hypothetical protein
LLGAVSLIERLQHEGTVDEGQLDLIPNGDAQLVQHFLG